MRIEDKICKEMKDEGLKVTKMSMMMLFYQPEQIQNEERCPDNEATAVGHLQISSRRKAKLFDLWSYSW